MTPDETWMHHAYQLAQKAETRGEVPVGAVLVHNNQLIAEGANGPIELLDPTAHAEIIALREGAKKLKNYRLLETTLYVTLEPCVMCVGAMIHARIQRLVFAARDPKAGAVVSVHRLLDTPSFNHRIDYSGDVLGAECGALLKAFFQQRR